MVYVVVQVGHCLFMCLVYVNSRCVIFVYVCLACFFECIESLCMYWVFYVCDVYVLYTFLHEFVLMCKHGVFVCVRFIYSLFSCE